MQLDSHRPLQLNPVDSVASPEPLKAADPSSWFIPDENYASADLMSVRVKSSPLNNKGSSIAFAKA